MGVSLSKFSCKQLRPCTPTYLYLFLQCQMQEAMVGKPAMRKPKPKSKYCLSHLFFMQAVWVPSSLEVRLLLAGLLDIDSTTLLPSQLNPFFLNLFAAHLESKVFSNGVTSYIVYIYPLEHDNDLGQNCFFTQSI